mmetsp:Transcript_100086/g.158386  ORF Transcript_100086/g.158386 Transcript_100086/m.158386 type:complete len:129 (+) Transcript_100086:62-448(+)|eukprot:CAMPEP_0169069610 /NCGR_PEP_ID=MMETSP1015-20121227/4665_1 /TAXON_ID=342587 /ORGANISM="Karlodinium micrum, Strain CCMP2283" /LENGTH=128 /DNA_ID=CAMNT_0009128535 /DNA_START=55 /DNA_END=441 /DNA_ORIENTATION=+
MTDPSPEELQAAREQMAVQMSIEFSQRAVDTRQYLDSFFGQEMKKMLQTLATERPADPKNAAQQVFLGKKSIGEIAKEPKTTEQSLRTAAPRQYLAATVNAPLVAGLARCVHEQPKAPITKLGEFIKP